MKHINKNILLISALFLFIVNVNAQDVIHCWDFNGTDNFDSPVSTGHRVTGNGTITHNITDVQAFGGNVANACSLSVAGAAFCPRPGTSLVNNGSNMTMAFPTTGYENIEFSFWFQRTSTGFNDNSVQISTNGGASFTEVAIISLGATNATFSFNFDTIPAANDNPNFQIRIVLLGGSGATGNNRYDNVKLSGTVVEAGPCSLTITDINVGPCQPSFSEGPPTFNFDVSLAYSNAPATGSLQVNVNSPGGGWSHSQSVPVGSISSPHTFMEFEGVSDGFSFEVTAFFTDDSGCLSQESEMAPDSCGFDEGDCEDLIISEYAEGSSFNKVIELYNTSNVGIDLGAENYYLQFYFNGSNTPSFDEPLSGIVPAGGTFVIAPTNASDPDIVDRANVFIGSSWFNGDDDVVLRKGGSAGQVVDRLGQVGMQISYGMDMTLRRKFNIAQGDTNISAPFDPSDEWDAFPNNDFSGLGSHDNACLEDADCPIEFIFVYGTGECEGECSECFDPCFECNDNGTFAPNDDFFELDVEVGYFPGAPATGYLILSAGGTVLATVHVSDLTHSFFHVFQGLTLPADGASYILTATFSDIPGCSYTDPFSEFTAPESCSIIEDCSLPFISEYIEGTGNNKCIEIYNPTDQTIDLATEGYQLLYYFNGNLNPGQTINLTGTVGAKGTYVVCNAAAFATTLIYADQLHSGAWYNGDDDIELRNTIGTVDFMGNLGVQQSYGMDITLRRKSFVMAGNPSPPVPFDPSIEWDEFPVNTVNGLKFHSSDCANTIDVFTPINIPQDGGCEGDFSGSEDPLELQISSKCWGGMISRHASFYTIEHCGDFDVSALVDVSAFGFAGIMVREALLEDTKTLYMYIRANGMIHWANRSNPLGQPQIHIRPMAQNQYMRMTRTGNIFRGFVSTNGTNWNMLFIAQVPLNSCLYVGFATHSHCNGANCWVESSYTNINHNLGGSPPINRPDAVNIHTDGNTSIAHEVMLAPNPAGNFVNLLLPEEVTESTIVNVMDVTGRIILTRTIESGKSIQLDLNNHNIPDGMYLVSLRYKNELITKRFIKSAGY